MKMISIRLPDVKLNTCNMFRKFIDILIKAQLVGYSDLIPRHTVITLCVDDSIYNDVVALCDHLGFSVI